jgi:hypothetical protein
VSDVTGLTAAAATEPVSNAAPTQVVETAADTAAATAQPVSGAVAGAPQVAAPAPVSSTATPVVDTVSGAAGSGPAAVSNTATPVTDTVAGTSGTVQATTDSLSHAGAPSTDAVKATIDPPTTSSPAASEAAGTANDAAGATGAPAPSAGSGVDAGLALAPSTGHPVLDGGTGASSSLKDPTPTLDSLLGATASTRTPAGASVADSAALAQGQRPSVFEAAAEYSPAVRVLASAAIISSVLGARAAAGGPGGARRLAFINARLMPCLVKASLERQIEAITVALARGGHAAAAFGGAGVHHAGGSGGADHSRLPRLLEQIGEGFNDVVSGGPRELGDGNRPDGLSDSRLLTQIGMLLGFVYLGFLTFWFWATRGRRQEERA